MFIFSHCTDHENVPTETDLEWKLLEQGLSESDFVQCWHVHGLAGDSFAPVNPKVLLYST